MPTSDEDTTAGDADGDGAPLWEAVEPQSPEDRPGHGLRVVPDHGACSDAELIDEVRRGDTEAYSRLYQRHVQAAYNLARQVARSAAESDDLVSEAFARVLDTLRGGRGPDTSFRAYLLTTLRHTAYDKSKADRRIEFSGDVAAVNGVPSDAVVVPFADPAVAGLERSLAAKAFQRLPERWQTVLWQTEIEEHSPAEVAPMLGLSPNGVSALAYRAREGLRQAYLQVHLAEVADTSCRATVDRLGAWTRAGLSKRETTHVEHHLDGCASCRELAEELVDMNTALHGVLPPLLLRRDTTGRLAAAGGDPLRAGRHQRVLGLATVAAAVATVVTFGIGAVDGPGGPAAPVTRQAAPGQVPARTPALTGRADPPVTSTTAQRRQPATRPATRVPADEPVAAGRPRQRVLPGGVSSLGVLPGSGDVRLRRGAPQRFDVTVHNNGSAASGDVTAELHLMKGVRALDPAGRQQDLSPGTYACPGGAGTVHCGTTQRVGPGESRTLRFLLLAERQAEGVLACTVHGGSASTRYLVHLSVDGGQGADTGTPPSPGSGNTGSRTEPDTREPGTTSPGGAGSQSTGSQSTEPQTRDGRPDALAGSAHATTG